MSGGTSKLSIIDATEQHLKAITDTYAWHVLNGTGSFEEVPPTLEEMRLRWSARQSAGYPTLVACRDGKVTGFAYAGPHKDRSAYRYTVEDSIYVAPGHVGQGVGSFLLAHLLDRCTIAGYRQMIAVIGDSENHSSIGLHRRFGFRHVGTATALGFKKNRWLDIVFMQRTLA